MLRFIIALIACQSLPEIACSQSTWNQYPQRIQLDSSLHVCITEKQYSVVLVGLEQRQLYYKQLQLAESIIDERNVAIRYLNEQIINLDNQVEAVDSIVTNERELSRKEKRKQWWAKAKNSFIVSGF